MLKGKKILIAVSGSIAAYKIAFFVRLLVKEGAEVQVIMTKAAKGFITPLTLATLSKRPVFSEYFDEESGAWNNHVELGLWPDLMLVAPLSAHTLGKMANGICDNLVLATYLSARCPVVVAPAMDLDMYQHPSTQENLRKIATYGNRIVEPNDGELASGLHGKGRMAEPEQLLELVQQHFKPLPKLEGKKVLLTSGPTHEHLDPVRFIGNHSSGQMGRALMEAFEHGGCEVKMISGPAHHLPETGDVIKVTSAEEMLTKATEHHEWADIVVFAAAVADYRPAERAAQKIKKDGEELSITFTRNPDIAKTLGEQKTNQLHIGFALETQNEEVNAKDKLVRKNFDLIVLNSLNDSGAGFQNVTNKVTLFDRSNNRVEYDLKHKYDVAQDIVDYIHDYLCE